MHILIPVLVAAVALTLLLWIESPTYQLIIICIAAPGMYGIQPMLYLIPSRFLGGEAVAKALAAIGVAGNLGGFVAQNAVPWVKDATESTVAPMALMGASLATVAVMHLVLMRCVSHGGADLAASAHSSPA